jgi:hypothetical protein
MWRKRQGKSRNNKGKARSYYNIEKITEIIGKNKIS